MHHGIHHFHGTPVWGSAGDVHRIAVSGAGAFVSYVRPDQIAASIQHAQVVGIDNGAFSAWVRGLKINWSDFYKWLLNYYHHPKVAFFVIPDVVDGGERDNDALISGLLGALLSPIGLVVTALAGVALVVWKYWQPITAFLAGVVEGFKAAAGPISAAFEPLKPVFQWIGDKVQALWGWFTNLLTPVKSTSAELQSAAAMGRRFGEALAEGLNMVMHPLDSLKSGVSWLLEKNGGRAAVVNFSSELLNKGNKTPAFSISIEGRDITTVLDNRLMSLTLTDNRGFDADQLDLELDDADGKIVLPRRGAVITLALGWKGQPLFPKGTFTVDEIEHTGAPDRLTIRARSADFRETLNTRREKSWHKTTVGEVVKEIAARHKLKMALGKDLSDKPVEHIDQTNESDGSFLMRLARQYGAIASVKNGNLLFIRQGQGKSATGKPLPVITITRKDGDSHRFTLADRGAYTGVIASWLHTREPAKKESTTVKRKRRTKKQKKEPEAKQGDYLVGTDENVLVLNRTYANRSNAERAAKMQWERLQRGVASFSLQLAEGRADLYTEMPVKVSGFKQPIDDAEWTITTLTHTVSPDNGFTTSLELEVRIDDFEME